MFQNLFFVWHNLRRKVLQCEGSFTQFIWVTTFFHKEKYPLNSWIYFSDLACCQHMVNFYLWFAPMWLYQLLKCFLYGQHFMVYHLPFGDIALVSCFPHDTMAALRWSLNRLFQFFIPWICVEASCRSLHNKISLHKVGVEVWVRVLDIFISSG